MRCLIVDDLLATGGTARATANFVKSQQAVVCGYAFMIEIQTLNGRDQLRDAPVISMFPC
jgi:adenine phosphoribosyltransferase